MQLLLKISWSTDPPTIPKLQEHTPKIYCLFLKNHLKDLERFICNDMCVLFKFQRICIGNFSVVFLKYNSWGWSIWSLFMWDIKPVCTWNNIEHIILLLYIPVVLLLQWIMRYIDLYSSWLLALRLFAIRFTACIRIISVFYRGRSLLDWYKVCMGDLLQNPSVSIC